MTHWQEKIRQLSESGLSIQIEQNGQIIFQSAEPMLKPLFLCLNGKQKEMHGATVIDKIVGLAAAYLCVLGQVGEVVTPLASESAKQFLKENHIPLQAARIIPQIMNRDNTGPCPMEQLAVASGSPQQFYLELGKRLMSRRSS